MASLCTQFSYSMSTTDIIGYHSGPFYIRKVPKILILGKSGTTILRILILMKTPNWVFKFFAFGVSPMYALHLFDSYWFIVQKREVPKIGTDQINVPLIIAAKAYNSLSLSSDWIIFWHHHHSHILGSMAVIIILKVNFRWKGGDIEIICVWKSKVWAESTHIFLAYYENFWGKCILYLCTLILLILFFGSFTWLWSYFSHFF